MAENCDTLLNSLYSEIGFVFGNFTMFKNRIYSEKGHELLAKTSEDIEKLICKDIENGHFIELFKNYLNHLSIRRTFDFFNYLFAKYNLEINDEEIMGLIVIYDVSNYLAGINEDSNIDPNSLLNNLYEVYEMSKTDFTFNQDIHCTEDSEKDYVNYIRQIPVLTAEEEKAKFLKLKELSKDPEKNKDEIKEIKDFIVVHNLRLVVSVAFYYKYRKFKQYYMLADFSALDLIQEGNIGLIKCIDNFDISKNVKFSTYAIWWIKQAIRRAGYEQGKTIRWPEYMVRLKSKYDKFVSEYIDMYGVKPSDKEIMKKLDINDSTLYTLQTASSVTTSLDNPVGEDEDSTIGDFCEDVYSDTPLEKAEADDVKYIVDGMLKRLATPDPDASEKTNIRNARSAEEVRRKFGIGYFEPSTLSKVGKAVGATRETVRCDLNYATRKLRFKNLNHAPNVIPRVRNDAEVKERVDNFNLFAHRMNMNLSADFDTYQFVKGTVELTCHICGNVWQEKINNLGKECICGVCALRMYKARNESISEIITDMDHKPEMYAKLGLLAKYIGIDAYELHYAIIRLSKEETTQLISRFNEPKSYQEIQEYNNLVDKVRRIVESEKKIIEKSRKRKKGV